MFRLSVVSFFNYISSPWTNSNSDRKPLSGVVKFGSLKKSQLSRTGSEQCSDYQLINLEFTYKNKSSSPCI